MTAPGTAHQVCLDVRPDAGLSLTLEPPGYALHFWRDGFGLVSHVANVGEFQTYTVVAKKDQLSIAFCSGDPDVRSVTKE